VGLGGRADPLGYNPLASGLGISALEANHNGDAILPSPHCAAVICIKVTVQSFRPLDHRVKSGEGGAGAPSSRLCLNNRRLVDLILPRAPIPAVKWRIRPLLGIGLAVLIGVDPALVFA